MGAEATNMCQDDQICVCLKAGIDVWDVNLSMEDWGFILVDERNTFNEIK